jgi:hypothetical protein
VSDEDRHGERRDGGLYFSPMQLREENRSDHEKFDNRLKRLEIAVALMLVYAFGQGGAAILSRLGGV